MGSNGRFSAFKHSTFVWFVYFVVPIAVFRVMEFAELRWLETCQLPTYGKNVVACKQCHAAAERDRTAAAGR